MTSSNERYEQWKRDYAKLQEEMDFAMKVFIASNQCKCKVYEGVYVSDYKICRHWHKQRDKAFGDRIKELHQRVLQNGFDTMKEIGVFP